MGISKSLNISDFYFCHLHKLGNKSYLTEEFGEANEIVHLKIFYKVFTVRTTPCVHVIERLDHNRERCRCKGLTLKHKLTLE